MTNRKQMDTRTTRQAHLMKGLDPDKVTGVQFLRAGRVRLTFDDPETRSTVLKNGLDIEGIPV